MTKVRSYLNNHGLSRILIEDSLLARAIFNPRKNFDEERINGLVDARRYAG
jgi:hypothetical protein